MDSIGKSINMHVCFLAALRDITMHVENVCAMVAEKKPSNSPHMRQAMAARKNTQPVPIYQLKVTLKHSKPPIWRRIQVRADITLYKLHQILQIAMGWTNSHLHQFIVGGVYYGEPHPDFGFEVINEKRTRLNQIIRGVKAKFVVSGVI
jgi:hypothetical protein